MFHTYSGIEYFMNMNLGIRHLKRFLFTICFQQCIDSFFKINYSVYLVFVWPNVSSYFTHAWRVQVFKETFYNILAILWLSAWLATETRIPERKNLHQDNAKLCHISLYQVDLAIVQNRRFKVLWKRKPWLWIFNDTCRENTCRLTEIFKINLGCFINRRSVLR